MMHSRVRILFGAVLVAGALIMGSTVPAQAASSALPVKATSGEVYQIDVSATEGWQGHIWVPAGTWVTIQSPSVGQYWTVDYRPEANLPYVAAQGYAGEPVWGGNTACKADQVWPYGALLYRLGDSRTGMTAGPNGYLTTSDGYLDLSINDLVQCQGDNAGYLPVTVLIG